MAARKPRPQSLCHVGTLDQSKPFQPPRLALPPLRRRYARSAARVGMISMSMIRYLALQMSEVFPEDDPLSEWLITLALAMNGAQLRDLHVLNG